jgi:hypothetical protein
MNDERAIKARLSYLRMAQKIGQVPHASSTMDTTALKQSREDVPKDPKHVRPGVIKKNVSCHETHKPLEQSQLEYVRSDAVMLKMSMSRDAREIQPNLQNEKSETPMPRMMIREARPSVVPSEMTTVPCSPLHAAMHPSIGKQPSTVVETLGARLQTDVGPLCCPLVATPPV